MSRAVELAGKCGFDVRIDGKGRSSAGWEGVDCTEELEAFYHAARAEALRKAAKECDARLDPEFPTELDIFSNFLRAMADREGK